VPTRNRHPYLAILLSSLLSQTFTHWDLLIVNDGDSGLREDSLLKGLFDIIEKKGHTINIISGPRKGPGHAHNLILANSSTSLILRVDDDVYLEPIYIEILYEFIKKGERVGGVGGRVLNPKYLTHPPQFSMDWRGKMIYKDGHFIPYEYHRFPPSPEEKPYEADHLYAHFLYYKEVVEKAGGFPEVYSQMGRREETDTTLRMKMAGYRLFVLPRAIAWHLHSIFGGIRDGIGPQNYNTYLLMEEEDIYTFENRFWQWIMDGLRKDIRIVIPDEDIKRRRLRYLLMKQKRSLEEKRSLDLNEVLEIISLKRDLIMRIRDEEALFLLLSKLLTTYERDEIEEG
jgi:GT2 family glycosyltransferase